MEILPIKQMVHMVSESFRRVSTADGCDKTLHQVRMELCQVVSLIGVVFRGGIAYIFLQETVIQRQSSTVSLRRKNHNIRKVLREDGMDPLTHTQSGQPLEHSSRMQAKAAGSFIMCSLGHLTTTPAVLTLAANDVTLRDAGNKCRGSVGLLAGDALATTETFGAIRKQCAKMHQSSGETH